MIGRNASPVATPSPAIETARPRVATNQRAIATMAICPMKP